MHNLISFNQRWSHDAANDEDKIDEYYECLIECTDNQSSCKRICSDILMWDLSISTLGGAFLLLNRIMNEDEYFDENLGLVYPREDYDDNVEQTDSE